ncbi:MAG: tRNA (adenosine(37)-N6)-threonylcarbamoyltransferase complex dimerization subunit type 1 TsaB [Candidatus Margulisiibacteriota bacterium]|nr:MAG: tRNA (adenosine(37)-N6)-threonylcarbamoyltransferase complex dimerization subunit type 1 TsaB [Candidatus Margulisbacteria bacterium GWD2_39_127]OGI02145.1 MAG: tRNA (adenosine(37)-N6)-threonylcarbamoyltransferase complex dimerization subunit type 1 TsaB [Candidatus Margulisbacteria bacterium GWF2_38_17]OGI10521.1 MAG: tRNA (adenosine(37)-N6)-threonylcarbamoyltransferase complex dimerization subunit type 1 TsaB [Candidatus Margulisbacteria bacterium GWE2_39_32]PZM79931.1 MAG: tRNA (adeno
MKILAISSSTNSLSIAIAADSKVIGESFYNHIPTLSENIVRYIKILIDETKTPIKSIQGVVVSKGPGAFTNLRVGITAAKVMSQILTIPIIGLDSLELVARNVQVSGSVVVIQKACRNDVNVAIYGMEHFTLTPLSKPFTINTETLAAKLSDSKGPLYLTGDGASLVFEIIEESIRKAGIYLAPKSTWEPRASTLAFWGQELLERGKQDNVLTLSPVYSHPPNIRKTVYGKNKNI